MLERVGPSTCPDQAERILEQLRELAELLP